MANTNLTDLEFKYLADLERVEEKRSALNVMLQDRFIMGRECGETAIREKLLENLCEAITNI